MNAKFLYGIRNIFKWRNRLKIKGEAHGNLSIGGVYKMYYRKSSWSLERARFDVKILIFALKVD